MDNTKYFSRFERIAELAAGFDKQQDNADPHQTFYCIQLSRYQQYLAITKVSYKIAGLLCGENDPLPLPNERPKTTIYAIYDRNTHQIVEFGAPELGHGSPTQDALAWDTFQSEYGSLILDKMRYPRFQEHASDTYKPTWV